MAHGAANRAGGKCRQCKYVGLQAKDLKDLDFKSLVGDGKGTSNGPLQLAAIEPGHIAPAAPNNPAPVVKVADDHSLDGNGVSLEEQMMKVSTNASDYSLITTLYKQNISMIKTALGGGVERLNARRWKMELDKSVTVAFAGMSAQSQRLKVIAENIANADSTAKTPDEDPYKRKVISFADELDKKLGVDLVKVTGVNQVQGGFGRLYEPGNPAADAERLRQDAERQHDHRNDGYARSAAQLRREP